LKIAADSAFKVYTEKVRTFRDEMAHFMKWGWFDFPSAENIAKDIRKRIRHLLGDLGYIEKKDALVEVTVWESEHSFAQANCDDDQKDTGKAPDAWMAVPVKTGIDMPKEKKE
jgi:hypothetical protein